MEKINKLLEAALEYRFKYNWSVIPLSAYAKIPPKGFDVIQFRSRLADKKEIESWWADNPNYNIGIITGKLSNILAIDLDKYKSEYSEEVVLQYIPDSTETVIDRSPRGGEHLYFQFPTDFELSIHSSILPGVDYRGEGGYILAPPSVFEGKASEWIIPPNGKPLPPAPDALLRFLKRNNNNYNNNYNNNNPCAGFSQNGTEQKKTVTSCDILLNEGSRDQTIFHFANILVKGGAKKEEILFILELLAKQCNPPFPENEITIKCNSAMQRAERKERNIAREVEDYIAVTSGDFTVTSCYQNLCIVTSCDKAATRKAINRLKDANIIEKVGNKDGVYRRIEKNFDFINFDENEPDEVEYPVKLPLGLNDIAEVSQGNIILVAGEFNAGKTAFLLNVLKMNKGKLTIRYISSEMKKSEFKKRFAPFMLPLSFWKQDEMTDYISKSYDFHTCIKPDALNIIDYMEFRDSDYTKGAEYLTQIHDKLNTGIAIVAIQKKEGQRMPRSGDMIVEKPRLAISLSKYDTPNDYPEGICSILKCKMPKLGKIDGKNLRFELQRQGSLFHVLNDWGFTRYKA
jgi:hypothetical protein